jgi:putative ABC transport system permease protein
MNTLHRPSIWALSWRSLWRDLRAGDLRLLIVAVALAVAALTSVGFFADRLKGGLQRDARQLLGGDAVVSSDNPHAQACSRTRPARWACSTAGHHGLSDHGAGDRCARRRQQAGGPQEPCRPATRCAASSRWAEQPGAAERTTRDIPPRARCGSMRPCWTRWAWPWAMQLLLGDAQLRIARIIVIEPDRGRRLHELCAARHAQRGRCARHRPGAACQPHHLPLCCGGAARRVKAFAEWAAEEVKKPDVRGVRVESLESGRPEMRQTLDRAQKFLSLVALLAALLSAVAVALAARGFAADHLDASAMLRVLGLQSQRAIAGAYTTEFALIGCLPASAGRG